MNKLAKDGAKLLTACSELAHEALIDVLQPGEIRLSRTTNLPMITHEQFLAWDKFDLVQEVTQDPGSFLGSLMTSIATINNYAWPGASASALVSDRLWTKYGGKPCRVYITQELFSVKPSRLQQTFLEMMKAKKFWKALQNIRGCVYGLFILRVERARSDRV